MRALTDYNCERHIYYQEKVNTRSKNKLQCKTISNCIISNNDLSNTLILQPYEYVIFALLPKCMKPG